MGKWSICTVTRGRVQISRSTWKYLEKARISMILASSDEWNINICWEEKRKYWIYRRNRRFKIIVREAIEVLEYGSSKIRIAAHKRRVIIWIEMRGVGQEQWRRGYLSAVLLREMGAVFACDETLSMKESLGLVRYEWIKSWSMSICCDNEEERRQSSVLKEFELWKNARLRWGDNGDQNTEYAGSRLPLMSEGQDSMAMRASRIMGKETWRSIRDNAIRRWVSRR